MAITQLYNSDQSLENAQLTTVSTPQNHGYIGGLQFGPEFDAWLAHHCHTGYEDLF